MNSPKWPLEISPSQIARLRETLTVPRTLVNNVLMQIAKQVDGNYQGPDYFSLP